MREFFCKSYKSLVISAYACSICFTVLFVLEANINAVSYTNNYLCYWCLSITCFFAISYLTNYKYLYKTGRVQKEVKKMILGLLPLICASIIQTVLIFWFIKIDLLKFDFFSIFLACIMFLVFTLINYSHYKSEIESFQNTSIEEEPYIPQFNIKDLCENNETDRNDDLC